MGLRWRRGRKAAIRYIGRHFDDADVDVRVIGCDKHQRYRLVTKLDFGQVEDCYCTKDIDLAQMDNSKGYMKSLLDESIEDLKIFTGRK